VQGEDRLLIGAGGADAEAVGVTGGEAALLVHHEVLPRYQGGQVALFTLLFELRYLSFPLRRML
jgi:hypothetical protein